MNEVSIISIFVISSLLFFVQSNVSEQRILEMKIKVITSVELASMIYGEIPALFPLYENFTKSRFEAKHKKDEDKKEKLKEFRKIHQFYAFKNKFQSYGMILDPIVNEKIDINELDIIKTNWNWTDDQVTRYEFLSKDKEGNFVFHDSEFIDFFLTEYILDNIFKPIDNPSDDEMELRLRILFYFTSDHYEGSPTLDEFIMTMIEDLQGPVFSKQIQDTIKTKFRYIFESYLSSSLWVVEKISKMFKKNEDILKTLWGAEQSEPYFLRFLKITSAPGNVPKLKAIAEKFFIKGQNNKKETKNLISAETVFKGRNQKLNILYRIFKKKDKYFEKFVLEITATEVEPQILIKLQQKIDFLDFVDSENFTNDEKREFYLANGRDFISNARAGDALSTLWKKLQNYFNPTELKAFLTDKDHYYNQTLLFLLPNSDNQNYVDTFFNLTKRYLNRDEIKEFLKQRRPITKESFITKFLVLVDNEKIFETCWNFVKEYLTHEEQRSLLLDKKGSLIGMEKIIGNQVIFKKWVEILSELYTSDVIRDELMKVDSENSTIVFQTVKTGYHNIERFDVTDVMKKYFQGHEEKLKKLLSKRNYLEQTAFEYSYSDEEYSKIRLKPFVELAKEYFNAEELVAIGITDPGSNA